MKIVRFQTKNMPATYGLVRGDVINIVKGDIFGKWSETGKTITLSEVRLLSPVVPVNVLCFGRNYKAHAEEGGESAPDAPIMFIKATSCVIGAETPIILPKIAPDQVDYEAELAVIIRKEARNVSEKNALDYVLGYTCANDVSSRDCQTKDGQWSRAKSFDTFCPMGPWIETELAPGNLRIQGRLNAKVMQSANTSLMIFNIPYLISYLSRGMTLLPSAVLLTGTPAGCGFAQKPPVWLKPGDVYEVEIEGIGVLRNSVISEK